LDDRAARHPARRHILLGVARPREGITVDRAVTQLLAAVRSITWQVRGGLARAALPGLFLGEPVSRPPLREARHWEAGRGNDDRAALLTGALGPDGLDNQTLPVGR